MARVFRGVQFYGDTTAGAAMVCATLAALVHRERTGEGQFAAVAATEALSSMIGDTLLEFSLTGTVPQHDGNRHADMAPHGVYPCRGGEWISLAAPSDHAWRSLCEALDAAGLAEESRFASRADRQKHAEELDAILSGLTAKFHAGPLAALLRHVDVPAHKSANSLDLISDIQLWQRETYTTVTDALGRLRPIVGAPWRFSRAPVKLSRGAPLLGEHNVYVYRDLLGLSEAKFCDLVNDGTIA
jgi:crotonobetainyl-CoA:carnitine CoA-transferase CaiB-like acyl-CoA transferase